MSRREVLTEEQKVQRRIETLERDNASLKEAFHE